MMYGELFSTSGRSIPKLTKSIKVFQLGRGLLKHIRWNSSSACLASRTIIVRKLRDAKNVLSRDADSSMLA